LAARKRGRAKAAALHSDFTTYNGGCSFTIEENHFDQVFLCQRMKQNRSDLEVINLLYGVAMAKPSVASWSSPVATKIRPGESERPVSGERHNASVPDFDAATCRAL
jgi:hypothetical protein